MIAYKAEIWCDGEGCEEGYGKGTLHDVAATLPQLASNLERIRSGEGWVIHGDKHFCPSCAKAIGLVSSPAAATNV